MKRAIRIILSPIVFIITFAGMIVIPISILCLVMGIVTIIYNWLTNKEQEYYILQFTFIGVVLPYIEMMNFINNKPIYN